MRYQYFIFPALVLWLLLGCRATQPTPCPTPRVIVVTATPELTAAPTSLPTITPSPSSTSLAYYVDPRLTWVSFDRPTVSPRWALTSVVYRDGIQSDGTANIYIVAQDIGGAPVNGVEFIQSWADGSASKLTRLGGTDFFMSGDSSFDPTRGEVGAYCIRPREFGDRICGLGLPLRQHVNYDLTYQRR